MRKHLPVLGAYTVLALVVTFPLAAHFATHVVGDGSDDPALTWNLWWFRHAVLDLQNSPLSTDFMFYPIGVNLVFYTLTLLNDALSLPLQALWGLVPATNILLLSSFVLCGYGMFLLTLYILTSRADTSGTNRSASTYLPAFAAGIVYAFSSNKMLYASLGQYNIASSQWIPFYVLSLFKLDPRSAARPAPAIFLTALFLLLQAYAETTFASFLVVFTFIFWLWHLRSRAILWGLTKRLALVSVLFVIGFAPILVPMAQELRVEGDFLVQGSGFSEAFSADALGFFVPSRLNPILGWLDARFDFPYINFVFLGWLTLALAILGAWAYRRSGLTRFWSASTLAFAIIALGPGLRVGGNALPIPLPFALFQVLPYFKANRYPSRYSVMITLGIAVLVAMGVQHLLAWWGRRWKLGANVRNGARVALSGQLAMISLIVLVLLAEHASALPLSDYGVPSFYESIRNDPGDFSVLEIPLDWRNSFRVTGTPDKVFMLSQYYQTVHEKHMLSGNISRNPELKFQYFTEAPVINSLIALESGHELDAATLTQDKQLAPAVMAFFDVRYIVLRPQAGDKVRPWLESVLPGLKLWREEDGVLVYRLEPTPPPATVSVDPRSPMARLYFAEGWGELGEQRVWAQRNETRLLLPKQTEDVTLALRLTVPDDGQTVGAVVNGKFVGNFSVQNGAHVYTLPVPAQQMDEPVNDVRLLWSKMLDGGWEGRLNPAASYPGSVVVKSAGEEVGDFAHIWINGEDVSPNQRGYNIAAIPPSGLKGIETNYFDTFESAAQADAMALRVRDYLIQLLAPGIGLALAVRDEGSRNMTPTLFSALQSIGVNTRIGWRWSYAFVRANDPTQPQHDPVIREDASPIRPAIVSIGERITSPVVAGAVEAIQIQPGDAGK